MAIPVGAIPAAARPVAQEALRGVVTVAPIIASKELNARVKEVYKVFEKTLKGWGDVALTAVIAGVLRVLGTRIPGLAPYVGEFTEAIVIHLILELDEKYSFKELAFFSVDEEGKKIVVEGADGEGIVCIDSGHATTGTGDNGCKHVTLSGGKAEIAVSIEAGTSIVFFMDKEGKWYIKLVPYKLKYA